MTPDKKATMQRQLAWIAITAAITLMHTCVHADQSISQISPKSENIPHFDDDEFVPHQSSSTIAAEGIHMKVTTIQSNEQPPTSNSNDSANAKRLQIESKNVVKSRVLRSASPILNGDEHLSKINSVEVELPIALDVKASNDAAGRYFNLIQPTSTLGKNDPGSAALSMTGHAAHARSDRSSSFLLKRGPRLIPSTSPSRPPVSTASPANDSTSIKPTRVTPMSSIEMQTAIDSNHGRQNPNPDIQDIITGIVKLLNGNVNVHANTQPQLQPSRRPHTRINNRGPPRISDVPPLPPNLDENLEYEPAPASTMRPPIAPYPFDRPEGPVRPFLSGIPLPEQIVPTSNNNYRPGFVSQQQQQQQQNRPPWQRPRPRPPILSNPNRRPVLTPPPYKYTPRPVQELRPPEIEHMPTAQSPQPPSSVEHEEKIPPNTNSPIADADLLENEKMPAAANGSSPTVPLSPSKEELTKKKDKLKKPISPTPATSPSIIQTKLPEVVTTTAAMKTIIQTASEVHSSQVIASSMPSIEPSEQVFTPKPQSGVTVSPSTEKTPELLRPSTKVTNSKVSSATKTTENIATSTSSKPNANLPSNLPTFHPRPGIVLDDPEFKPGSHARPPTPPAKANNIQPSRVHPPNLPPGYGEIFDVTLSAIQGPGNGGANSGLQTINIKPFGGAHSGNNDIIITASGDDSFVSIDGKRTYINLFGESTEAPNQLPLAPKSSATVTAAKTASIQPTKTVTSPGITGTGYAVADTEVPTKAPYTTSQKQTPPRQTTTSATHPTRPQYRTRPQQPPVRIDTCIVGDDTTCDMAQNEKCKTDAGVSSCHCRPGFSRRKHREPCRKVVSILLSMRVDKFYERRIKWDALLADPNSEAYSHLSYEAVRAIDSAMSMTPFSDEFMDARINKIYQGDAAQGAAGVFVNMTIELEENGETLRPNIKSDIQKHLLGVIHRRNNNIGNSVLYVETPAGSISNLQDLDECSSAELNDCHSEATCTNVWGSFRCQCSTGFRDPWSDQVQRSGRDCQTCSDSYCNNRGTCSYDATGTQQVCECIGAYYGQQCEIDGEVLAVAIGASVIAVIIIVLTLICLVMWSRRWHREQKDAMGSPVFGYMSGTALGAASQMKSSHSAPFQVTLEDRMRWAQIADVMAQTNHYAAEPVATNRPPSAIYGYPNLQMMANMNTMQTLSMAGTLPMHHHPGATLPPIPMPRYGLSMHARANGMRTLENSSSSEEEDRADLLGRNFQVPRPKSRSNGSIANQSGIYYDVDYEPSGGELYGGTTTTTTTTNHNSSSNNNSPSSAQGCPQGIPMSTYKPGRIPTSYFMK